MSIKRDTVQSSTTGILDSLKVKKEDFIKDNIKPEVIADVISQTEPKIQVEPELSVNNNKEVAKDVPEIVEDMRSIEKYNSVKDIAEQAKELIKEDEEPVRRTFTIEALTHTKLNELKVYVLPAVTGQKKWGYNDIVNLALKEFYENQMQLLQKKIKK